MSSVFRVYDNGSSIEIGINHEENTIQFLTCYNNDEQYYYNVN